MRLGNVLAILLTACFGASAQQPLNDAAALSAQAIKSMVTDSAWAKPAPVPGRKTPVIVRWESALPVYEACAQGGVERYLFSCASKLLYLSGLAEKFQRMIEHFYVLSISNYPKPLELSVGPQPPEHSSAANAQLASLGKRIGQGTSISCTAKVPLRPVDVVVLPAGSELLVLIFFSRSEPLTLQDDEVSFESIYGNLQIKSTFQLKEMIYKSELEL